YVYFGNQLGQFYGLNRLDLHTAELRVKYQANAFRSIYQQEGINGKAKWVELESKFYDPRIRPWYQAVGRETRDLWTSVYIDFKSRELVATRARQVKSNDPLKSGVVATDVSLKTLNDFVRTLRVSEHGFAFILERNGNLIASSISDNVQRLSNGDYGRLNARESDENIVKQVYLAIEQDLKSHKHGIPGKIWVKQPGGDKYLVGYAEVRDQAGLDWLSVVAIPNRDILGGLNTLFWRSLIIGILALLFSVAIGYGILSWVSRDVRLLSKAAKLIGQGEWEEPIKVKRNDEIGVLAAQMEYMRQQLQTDKLTGLPNRTALEKRISKRIKNRPKDEFLLLLLDVDLFKIINEHYGHHIGDQILESLSSRLSEFLSPNDYAARFYEDGFALILDLVSNVDASYVTQKVAQVMSQNMVVNNSLGEQIHFTLTCGSAHYPTHAGTTRSLIKFADQCLYLEKAARK
ncbi:MAG: hypothetical protein RLZZ502_163, partial [Pseudomonadota bacterium]